MTDYLPDDHSMGTLGLHNRDEWPDRATEADLECDDCGHAGHEPGSPSCPREVA